MLNPTPTAVWTAPCADRPGALAALLEPLAMQGADLQFLLARRLDSNPEKAMVFVAPIVHPNAVAAAESHGFKCLPDLHVVRVDGTNEPGIAYLMARAMADEKISIRAISSIAIRSQFMAYLAFDSERDAARAIHRLNVAL
jgi:prephenate dehydratase